MRISRWRARAQDAPPVTPDQAGNAVVFVSSHHDKGSTGILEDFDIG